MTNEQRDKLLIQISCDISEMKTKLNTDYKTLHGNGSPGLVHSHSQLEKRVAKIENDHEKNSRHWGLIAGIVAFIVNASIALYAIFKR